MKDALRFPADAQIAVKQVWQIPPGPQDDPGLVYAGVCRTDEGGRRREARTKGLPRRWAREGAVLSCGAGCAARGRAVTPAWNAAGRRDESLARGWIRCPRGRTGMDESILARLQTEMVRAMKEKDAETLSTVRMLKSALMEAKTAKPKDATLERRRGDRDRCSAT